MKVLREKFEKSLAYDFVYDAALNNDMQRYELAHGESLKIRECGGFGKFVKNF